MRLLRAKSILVLAILVVISMGSMMTACSSEKKAPEAQVGINAGPDGKPASYKEPVRLSSTDGVLEVRLSAHQSTVNLDTVKVPVTNFLTYGYDLIKGTSSNGATKGDNLYPAPTLRVDPGEKLIIHYDNDLQGLTIKDYYDPAFTPAGGDVPLYPPPLEKSPLNLHTHGLHVSPDGNADNVLLDIPASMGNTYTYDLPETLPQGLYWYHSHRHTVTAQQTYLGLAGMLEIGRADGNLPLATQNNIPVRSMALQYNFVFDRKGGGHELTNPTWSQWLSTLKPPTGDELAKGTYEPSLAPVNFADSAKGTQYMTNWYAGPLSPANHRGQNQFVPSNLQSFASPTKNVPVDPKLPENQRDIQFTVNGQFQPELKVKPGQTEIWAVGNFSDIAYMTIGLTETATGNHAKFNLVGQDGVPMHNVQPPVDGDGTRLLIPPGSRYAFAVTMPKEGDLLLEMPKQQGVKPVVNPGVLYTNNGTDKPEAALGTVTVDPDYISYTDGFFTFPTQTLMRATPDTGEGQTTAFEPGQNLNSFSSFVDTSVMTPDVTRELKVTGGFGNKHASNSDPKAFTYEFADNTFPYIPLIQPRLNSVEEWKIVNFNNDAHPMHVHVNDFQVTEIVNPIAKTRTGVQMWGEDNVNVPGPVFDENEVATEIASTTLRTKFTEFTGTFVIHCHRLNHEDNGLMALVNVIPAASTYATVTPGSKGNNATVQVRDGNGDKVLATVFPFPNFEGTPSVAMADVNGDMVLDLVVGTGPGVSPEVVAYSGDDAGPGRFRDELVRFAPFDADFKGGVTVAGDDIDGNALADNIIVGSGPGIKSQVKVYSSTLPSESGNAPEVFSAFTPYPRSKSGVALATGLVDAGSGRPTIVTAPGPGDAPRVKTFRYDLFTPTARSQADGTAAGHFRRPNEPTITSEFLAYDENYTGGVTLSTGWVAGAEGGAKSVVTGQVAGDTVRVWSTGSRLDGSPKSYLLSPNHHDTNVEFGQIASFAPIPGAKGVTVATTSTTHGADLLVSAAGPGGPDVRKLGLARSGPDAKTLSPDPIVTLPPIPGPSAPSPLAGR